MVAQRKNRKALRALHSDVDHAAALQEIDDLWDERDSDAQDRLEVLTILVEAYEREHHRIPTTNPIAAILFRMEQMGMSKAVIRTLSEKLAIPVSALIEQQPKGPGKRGRANVRARAS